MVTIQLSAYQLAQLLGKQLTLDLLNSVAGTSLNQEDLPLNEEAYTAPHKSLSHEQIKCLSRVKARKVKEQYLKDHPDVNRSSPMASNVYSAAYTKEMRRLYKRYTHKTPG